MTDDADDRIPLDYANHRVEGRWCVGIRPSSDPVRADLE